MTTRPKLTLLRGGRGATTPAEFHAAVLAQRCPTCQAPAGQPCAMPPLIPCLPRDGVGTRYLQRRWHLTRADKVWRPAERNHKK
jgi:hypothetical protein